MFTLHAERSSRELPFTYRDKQVLDEMFKNFDLDRLIETEALLPNCLATPLDPLEETAWIEGSYDAELEAELLAVLV